MIRSTILAISISLMGIASAQEAPTDGSETIEGIAAIVNDIPISYTDVRQRARFLLLGLGRQQPTPEQLQQITGQALEQLIDEKLQLEEAAEYEVEIEAAEIASAVEDMARQSGTNRENLFEQLLAAGVNPASLEEQMRAEIAWRRIMGGLFGSRIRISDNQIDDQIRRIKAAASKTQYQVSEIFLFAPDEENKEQAFTAAESIVEQLRQGAPFQVAAQQFSSSPTAATGGDMGWVSLPDIDEELAAAVRTMEGPGLTDPILVDNGVYIIAVNGRREPTETTTVVDLQQVISVDGDDQALQNAVEQADGCESLETVTGAIDGLTHAPLGRVNIDELGEEGAELVSQTEIGSATEIFAMSSGLAVIFVCDREDGVENVPSRAQIEDRLVNQQLGMMSERTLRNLRREATIIRR